MVRILVIWVKIERKLGEICRIQIMRGLTGIDVKLKLCGHPRSLNGVEAGFELYFRNLTDVSRVTGL